MKASFCMAVSVVLFSSIINTSSISNIWAIIGQLQLMFFLILTRVYLPKDVIDFITSSNYILLLFNFIPLSKAQKEISWLNWIDYDQNDDLLNKIGIQSESTYVNNISFAIFLFIVIPIHLFLLCMYKKIKFNEGFRSCKKISFQILKYVVHILTFSYYVRCISESYQMLCLSSFSEIMNYSTSSSSHKISLSIAFLVAAFNISFFCFVCWIAFSNKEEKSLSHKYFIHYYGDLKESRKDRLFLINCIARRLLLSIIVIFISNNGKNETSKITARISIIVGLQAIYLLYSILKRPFKETSDNIVLILNEIFFFMFSIWILCLNKENSWKDSLTSAFISLLMLNTLTILLLIICINLIQLIKLCLAKKNINKVNTMQPSIMEEQKENSIKVSRKYHNSEISSRMDIHPSIK